MIKICKHCKQEFETQYKSEMYCTGMCKDNFKALEYKEKWARGKPKTNNSGTAFRLFSLSKRNVDKM